MVCADSLWNSGWSHVFGFRFISRWFGQARACSHHVRHTYHVPKSWTCIVFLQSGRTLETGVDTFVCAYVPIVVLQIRCFICCFFDLKSIRKAYLIVICVYLRFLA